MYKLTNNTTIIRTSDGACIPNDPANKDFQEYQKWLSVGNTPISADVPTLAQVKAEQTAKINQAADSAFDAIISVYPRLEVSTWPNQYAEAWALKTDPLAYTPTLTAIALQADVTVPILSASVLLKAASYTQASGLIIGKRKKLTDKINLSTTSDQIKGIVW